MQLQPAYQTHMVESCLDVNSTAVCQARLVGMLLLVCSQWHALLMLLLHVVQGLGPSIKPPPPHQHVLCCAVRDTLLVRRWWRRGG